MSRVHLSQRCRADLEEISERIGYHSIRAAQRTTERLIERLRLLRDHPLAGDPLESVRPGIRGLRCGHYLIL